jgi:hypothetical protein
MSCRLLMLLKMALQKRDPAVKDKILFADKPNYWRKLPPPTAYLLKLKGDIGSEVEPTILEKMHKKLKLTVTHCSA